MIYVLNLLIVIYLALMFYYWGSIQGLLSAFLHLILTIVAGAIALALWEPITVGFLLNSVPGFAWALGLLGPFVLILIGLRVVADKVIPGNMRFHPVVNVVAGGFCGLGAGVLISGLTIIGLGFVPMDTDFMGYQPLKLLDTGQVAEGGPGTLWLAVDRRAAGFFTAISGGSFYPGFLPGSPSSLALYRPDLAMEPCVMRLSRAFDAHSLVTAAPDKITAERVLSRSLTAEAIPADIRDRFPDPWKENDKMVIVDTIWEKGPELYDGQTLRVPPTEIRLIAWRDDNGRLTARVVQPIGVTDRETENAPRQFWQLNSQARNYPNTQASKARFGWVFALSPQEEPKFLLARDLRVELPAPVGEDDASITAALGHYVAPTTQPAVAVNNDANTINPTAYKEIELTSMLPMRTTRVAASRLQATADQTGIDSGDQDGIKPNIEAGRIDKEILLDHINFASNAQPVRIQIGAQERSLLGSSVSRAKLLNGLALVDDKNERHYPTAWVKYNKQSYVQDIHVGFTEIEHATDFKIPTMSLEQDLYIYFPILRGTHLIRYELGSAQTKDINLTIPR